MTLLRSGLRVKRNRKKTSHDTEGAHCQEVDKVQVKNFARLVPIKKNKYNLDIKCVRYSCLYKLNVLLLIAHNSSIFGTKIVTFLLDIL